ncbi:MAG: zinc ribbon domain-containing protein [Anaerolineales bacterium]
MGKRKPVLCPACQSSNDADANFCLNCGYRLSLICARCSRRMAASAKFCDRCGLSLVSELQPQEKDRSAQSAQPAISVKQSSPNNGPKPVPAMPSQPAPEPPAPTETSQKPVQEISPLTQYIPQALMKKLESARAIVQV